MLILFSMLKLLYNIENKLAYGVLRLVRGTIGQAKDATINEIQIVYDSPHFLVVNKRHDVLINHDDKTIPVTVEKQLERLYPDLVNPKLAMSFYFCHRLDYSTSGILLIAKHKKACGLANKAFQQRTTKKYYLGIVRGHISQNELTISERIGNDTREQFQLNRMATHSSPHCSQVTKDASTHVIVLERGFCYDYPATKILMRPVTGRRHQLRLHCSHIGHTIVGDYTYSNRKDLSPFRMFLHAYRLVLPNNIERLDITTDDPFTSNDYRNSWISCEKINSINAAFACLNDKSI